MSGYTGGEAERAAQRRALVSPLAQLIEAEIPD
jgi:hypothetical protein